MASPPSGAGPKAYSYYLVHIKTELCIGTGSCVLYVLDTVVDKGGCGELMSAARGRDIWANRSSIYAWYVAIPATVLQVDAARLLFSNI